MRIGLIGSGYDILPLLGVLNQYEHEYHFFCDRKHAPWGNKSTHLRNERIETGVKYLTDTVGVDCIIAPVLYELANRGDAMIMGLYNEYLSYALQYSLVGKLGLLCDSVDMEAVQELLKPVTKAYALTENQMNTKPFKKDFPVWKKALPMRSAFISTYSSRDRMVRKTIKTDLSYFTDAGVDTLLPLNRGFLFRQRLIKQRVNWKKTRFHGLDVVASSFEKLTEGSNNSPYSMTIHYTDFPQPILQEKKRMQILEKGGATKVILNKI